MGVTREIKEFLDRAELSLTALDKVSMQLEITLVDARELIREGTQLARQINSLIEHGRSGVEGRR